MATTVLLRRRSAIRRGRTIPAIYGHAPGPSLVGRYLDSSSRGSFGSRSYAGISQASRIPGRSPLDFASPHGNEIGVSRDKASCQEPWGTNEVAHLRDGQ